MNPLNILRKTGFIPCLALLLLAAGPLPAQQMNYQGRLTDANGNAVADGQYTLIFDLYDAATGGTPVWGTQTNVADVVQGRFNVVLGPTAPTGGSLGDAFNGGLRYLQITVGDNPILPRQQLLASPEAFRALHAQSAVNAGYATNAGNASFATQAASVGDGGSSVITLLNNNVGIGNTNPVTKLDVNGTNDPVVMRVRGGAGGWRGSAAFGNTNANVILGELSGVATVGGHNAALNGWANLALNPGGGNVGIGTASPATKLDVNGVIAMFNGNTLQARNSVGTLENVLWPRWVDNYTYLNYGSAGFHIRNNSSALTMSMSSAGNVGIGAAANNFRLNVAGGENAQLHILNSQNNKGWTLYSESTGDSGNLVVAPSTGGVFAYLSRVDCIWRNSSDARLKRDISPLDGVLDRVLKLRPVSYYLTNAPVGAPLSLGLIAQEVEPLFPEVVGEHQGMKSLAYTQLVPVTIRAIQELNQKVEAQETELTELRAEVTRLRGERGSLAQTVSDLAARFADLEKAARHPTTRPVVNASVVAK